ncbi:hypothetical protein Tco_0707439 [Tanacetum coccineum]|uniref:PUB 12/19-like N-terminal domain-containing protein n=1 Tax=Tanacetum coccineum TaxID=301880 RepID=A0ABQ4YCI1_9ASTR
MEEENVLSNARVVRDVAEELIGIIEGVKSIGEIRGTQKKECQILILEADAMVTKFHTVYDKLNHAINGFLYKEIGISEEVNEQIHWVKWDLVLASKYRGGLIFGSLHSLNLALLYKWRWRFYNQSDALWTKIIKNLYPFTSEDQGWDQVRKQVGPWNNIMQIVSDLHNTGMVPRSAMKRKIGDGMISLFWHDIWINETFLAHQFPRLFLLEEFKNVVVGDRWNGSSFSWNWRRPLRGGVEDDQYHKICDIIKQEIWRFRNDFIFRLGKKRDVDIMDSIIHISYLWYRNRHKNSSMRWDDWLKNPISSI